MLRNVEAQSDQVIHQSMQSFKQNGFINYYGMQRFGTRSVSTHSVGIALLAEKWEQAIDLIMCPKAEGMHWIIEYDYNVYGCTICTESNNFKQLEILYI